MKRYLRLSIIRKLPLFVVLSVLLLTVAFTSATSIDFGQSTNQYYSASPRCDVASIVSTFFLIMASLPFFSMNYRYSIGRSDLYRQVAFKDKRIRYAENLSSLIIVCIAFTIALGVMVSTLAARNYIITEHPTFYLHYEWFILMYLICLVVGAGLYFISYLFISRSNVFINSLLMLGLGYTLVNCFVSTLLIYFFRDSMAGLYFLQGPSPIGAISFVSQGFEALICYNESFLFQSGVDSWYYAGAFYAFIIEFALLMALGIVAFLVEKDPSSEWAGKPDSDKPYQEIIFHAGFGTIGLFIGLLMGGSIFTTILSLLFYVSYAASYYTLYGLLRRNFKLKGYQFAIIFGNVGLSIIAGLIYMAIY